MAPDVVERQVPRLAGDYDVGGLFVGVNDVRSTAWDGEAFARDHAAALAALAERCTRSVTLTIPLDLGRPRAGAKVADANAAIRANAAARGALVVDLADLRPWHALLPDAVHPHAVGQVEIADRAARVLGAPTLPSTLTDRDGGARAQARWARGYARMWARDVVRRVREGGLAGLK